jgi:hypothetical protein
VAIGLAVKDAAEVEASGLEINGARHYALAAYVKKPEFGPSQLRATGLSISGSGMGDHCVQTGCRVVLDGVELPTQDLDVERLYAEKILGQ